MTNVPSDLRYTKTHEWVKTDGDTVEVGVDDYAQEQLGDITYLELPDVGTEVVQGEPLGVVESVKAATDVYAPVTGEVVEALLVTHYDPIYRESMRRNFPALEAPDCPSLDWDGSAAGLAAAAAQAATNTAPGATRG